MNRLVWQIDREGDSAIQVGVFHTDAGFAGLLPCHLSAG